MTTLSQYRLALQRFQSARLRRDYGDLAERPEYAPVARFFFDEMYGAHDFSERDAGARRLQGLLHLLPGVHLRDLEAVLELGARSDRLDDDLARLALRRAADLSFDEAAYDRLYREADNYGQRLRQLELVRSCLQNVFHLSRSQLLGVALHRAGLVARLAGIGAAYSFLVKGYDALRGVSDIRHFSETIYSRELARLDRIYQR